MAGSVRKRGKKWYYSIEMATVDGKRKRVERVGGDTKKEAELALRNAQNVIDQTGDFIEPSSMSYSDYLDFWLTSHIKNHMRDNTFSGYSNIVAKHIKPHLGHYRLSELTPARLQAFVNTQPFKALSTNYTEGIMATISGSLNYAVIPMKYIRDNPMKYVTYPKIALKKKEIDTRVFTDEEFQKIMARFPEGNNFHVYLLLLYYTGARSGEVCALTWDCIDFDKGTIHYRKTLHTRKPRRWYFGPPKTESSNRVLRMGEALETILRLEWQRQHSNREKYGKYYSFYKIDSDEDIVKATHNELDFVCRQENGDFVTINTVKYCSKVINYGLGIPFNPHALRHTHATLLLENGANIKDIQKRLGHHNISTTLNTYSHVTANMESKTVGIMDSLPTSLKYVGKPSADGKMPTE